MFATNTFAQKRDITLEEETYIDDIAFNTEWVVYQLTSPSLDLEEETYVDDIPFETEKVVEAYYYRKSVMVNYKMTDEN